MGGLKSEVQHLAAGKVDDLRRELLEYAYTDGQSQQADASPQRTESEFERLVLTAIQKRGYKVRTQHAVGFYRIDMVVEGGGRRLAVECDGERWHSGTEKIAEDLARQAVLERLGWQFHRLRGGQFFRDPEGSLGALWTRLDQLDIRPAAAAVDSHPGDETHESLLRVASTLRNSWFPVDSSQVT